MTGIYEIEHRPSGRVYVGSSDDIRRRLRAHRALLRRGAHENVRLQRAWIRDGEAAFDFRAVEECPIDRLRDREAELIGYCAKVYNTSPVVRPGAPAANSSVSDDDVLAIYGRAGNGERVVDLAMEYGVSLDAARRIVAGRTYARLTGGGRARPMVRARGARNANSKLTEDAVRSIRARFTGKHGQKGQLAQEYGVTRRVITLVVRRETWAHVH